MGAGVGTTGWGRPREGSRVDANNSMRYLCYGAFARGDARASGFGTREETRRRDCLRAGARRAGAPSHEISVPARSTASVNKPCV